MKKLKKYLLTSLSLGAAGVTIGAVVASCSDNGSTSTQANSTDGTTPTETKPTTPTNGTDTTTTPSDTDNGTDSSGNEGPASSTGTETEPTTPTNGTDTTGTEDIGSTGTTTEPTNTDNGTDTSGTEGSTSAGVETEPAAPDKDTGTTGETNTTSDSNPQTGTTSDDSKPALTTAELKAKVEEAKQTLATDKTNYENAKKDYTAYINDINYYYWHNGSWKSNSIDSKNPTRGKEQEEIANRTEKQMSQKITDSKNALDKAQTNLIDLEDQLVDSAKTDVDTAKENYNKLKTNSDEKDNQALADAKQQLTDAQNKLIEYAKDNVAVNQANYNNLKTIHDDYIKTLGYTYWHNGGWKEDPTDSKDTVRGHQMEKLVAANEQAMSQAVTTAEADLNKAKSKLKEAQDDLVVIPTDQQPSQPKNPSTEITAPNVDAK